MASSTTGFRTCAALQVLGELGFNRRHLGGKLRVELGQHAVRSVHRHRGRRHAVNTQLRTLHPGSSEPWSCPPASPSKLGITIAGLVGVVRGAQRRLRRQREVAGAVGNLEVRVHRRRDVAVRQSTGLGGRVQYRGRHAWQRWQVGCVNVRDVLKRRDCSRQFWQVQVQSIELRRLYAGSVLGGSGATSQHIPGRI